MNKALILDDDQKKAFAQLKRAFTACAAVKLEIHGELTTLYAVNGRHMSDQRVAIGEEIDDAEDSVSLSAEQFRPQCFKGCAADDGLSIASKCGKRKIKYDEEN